MKPPSDFFERVYAVVRRIPPGRVTSYGAVACAIGAAGAARTVGYAMNASQNDPTVPAHRVVNRVGLLTGKFHFGGLQAMQQQLEEEGIEIKNDAVVHFQRHFWDPMTDDSEASAPFLPHRK